MSGNSHGLRSAAQWPDGYLFLGLRPERLRSGNPLRSENLIHYRSTRRYFSGMAPPGAVVFRWKAATRMICKTLDGELKGILAQV